ELERLVTKHRKFAGAQWALPPDAVNRIAEVAAKQRPDTPELIHHRLFVQRDFELMDEKGDYEVQRERLDRRRQAAVAEILQESGIDGVLAFAESVSAPSQVGQAMGTIAPEHLDAMLLPEYLRADEPWAKQMM